MQIKHIRPGTLEWSEAVDGEVTELREVVDPEEALRLRRVAELERMTGPLDTPAMVWRIGGRARPSSLPA
jgi:hypothetical protein